MGFPFFLSFHFQVVLCFHLFVYAFFTPLFGCFLYIIHCFLLVFCPTFFLVHSPSVLNLTLPCVFSPFSAYLFSFTRRSSPWVFTHHVSPSATSWAILLPQLSPLNCSVSGPVLILLKECWLLGSAFHTQLFCLLLSRFVPLNSGCLMKVSNLCARSSLTTAVVSGKGGDASKSALEQKGPN